MDLQEKVALVTGAVSGIGYSITYELLKTGIKGVVLVDLNAEAGQQTIKSFGKEFGDERVIFVKANVTSRNEYEDAFKKAIEVYGRIDIVVNNAGIMNDINYEKCIETNLTGVTHGTMLGLKYMGKDNEKDGGIIMNTSSISVICMQHTCPVYGATKAGVLYLVRSMGHPFHYNRTGVKIIALCPGGTSTPIYNTMEFLNGCLEECVRLTMQRGLIQVPDVVGRAAVYAIQNGESASAYVSDQNKLYLLKNPDWDTYLDVVVEDM
ncbi:Photoreceptor dehydrogenase [Carabus blaptoides fortunei]